MSADLKPCPFCRAPDEELALCYDAGTHPLVGTDWFVRCYVCHVETARFATQAEAVTAWNARAEGPAPATRPYPFAVGTGKYSELLVFEGGELTVNTTGFGDANGTGWLCFHEDDLEWERGADGKDYRIANLDRSEMVALRDKLNEVFPAPVSAPLDREAFTSSDDSDAPLEAAAREAGWALGELVDGAPWERRPQIAAIIARLGLALTDQKDQVGGPTPAVLGEPSGEPPWPSGEDDPVGAAERDMGRYIYRRIETLMGAKHVTGIANELTYLATIAEAVEEYGAEACGGEDLSVFQGPPPPAGGVK